MRLKDFYSPLSVSETWETSCTAKKDHSEDAFTTLAKRLTADLLSINLNSVPIFKAARPGGSGQPTFRACVYAKSSAFLPQSAAGLRLPAWAYCSASLVNDFKSYRHSESRQVACLY